MGNLIVLPVPAVAARVASGGFLSDPQTRVLAHARFLKLPP